MVKQIYPNLSVKNLPQSMDFFRKLGFSFNPHFTNDDAAGMVIGENVVVMLLTESFFSGFTSKQICDTSKSTEVLLALEMESRDEVDEILTKALQAGAHEHRPAQNESFMYSRSFEDIDGHTWEIFYMNAEGM